MPRRSSVRPAAPAVWRAAWLPVSLISMPARRAVALCGHSLLAAVLAVLAGVAMVTARVKHPGLAASTLSSVGAAA
jgi:hypothetical protein